MSTATSPDAATPAGAPASLGLTSPGGAASPGGSVSPAGVALPGAAASAEPARPWLDGLPLQGPPVPPEWYAAYYAQPKPDVITRFAQRMWTRSPIWAAPFALLVCMGGAVGYTLASHPTEIGAGDPPTCLLKYTTGFVCPGCGGTRAAWYLMHADLPAAARHHAIFVFAVPFLIYLYVAWAGKRLFNWRLPQFSVSPRVLVAFLAVWGVWSVLRNLPWAPFTGFYV